MIMAGMLYDRDQKKAFARGEREFAGSERNILSADGAPVFRMEIRQVGRRRCGYAAAEDDLRTVRLLPLHGTGK